MNFVKWILNFILLIILAFTVLILHCMIWLTIIAKETCRHLLIYKKESLHYNKIILLRSKISDRLEFRVLMRLQQLLSQRAQRLL